MVVWKEVKILQWILVIIAAVILSIGSPSDALAQENTLSANENVPDSGTISATKENSSPVSVILLHNDETVDLNVNSNVDSQENPTHSVQSDSVKEVPTTIPSTSAIEVKNSNVKNNPVVVEKTSVEETKRKQNSNPILNVNLLGLDISLLGEDSLIGLHSNNDTKSVLSVSLTDKIGVDVLSKKDDLKSSLANIKIDSNALGKINAELLSFEREQGTHQYTGSALNVGIKDSLLKSVTGDIHLSILSKDQNRKGVANLDIRNSDLLGEIGLNVISGKSESSEFGKIEETKLLGLYLNNFLIGENDLNVLNNRTQIVGDKKYTQSVLLNANLKLVGENNISLLDINKEHSPNYTKTHSGLLAVQLNNSLLGNVNSSVLQNEYVTLKNAEGKTVIGITNNGFDKQSTIHSIGKDQAVISLSPKKSSEREFLEYFGLIQPFDPSNIIIDKENAFTENELDIEGSENSVRNKVNEWFKQGKEVIANEVNSILQQINNSKETRIQVMERIQSLTSQNEVTTNHSNHSNSGTTNANISDGQSHIAGYVLNEIIRSEINKSKLKWQQNDLSNQWIKPPPWKPPIQDSFFTI